MIRDIVQLMQYANESLVKSTGRTYFHGSNTELPIGTVLMPRVDSRVDSRVEELLEEHRPEDYLSRNNAVFMAATPRETHESGGTSYEYVYEVKPLGPVSKHALYFLHETEDPNYMPDDKDIEIYQAECAHKYWIEKPVPNEMVEYLTTSARIVRRVE